MGRFGESIYIFELLENEHFQQILTNNLKKQIDLLTFEENISITITERAREVLLKKSQEDRTFGARSLESAIRKYVRSSLANIVNSNQVLSGEELSIDFVDGKFTFQKLVYEEISEISIDFQEHDQKSGG
jgi:ATP-dependent Clp protease ATP-binding subunit ClpB